MLKANTKGQERRLGMNGMRMLTWMCEVSVEKKNQETTLKRCGHARRREAIHMLRKMTDAPPPGKESERKTENRV